MNKKAILITCSILIGILIAGTTCTFFGCREHIFAVFLDDFEECAQAGFPVIASSPPRCYVTEDDIFVRQPQHIRVYQPEEGSIVTSPFQLSGEARALGNTVEYELIGENKNMLAVGSLPTKSPEHGRWGDFSGNIKFYTETEEEQGTLNVFDRTQNGTRVSMLTIPVRFREASDNSESEVAESENKNEQVTSQKEVVFDPLKKLQQSTEEIPNKIRLNVPFTPQAPFADWSAPFNEACEEASLIMAEYYVRGDDLSANQANSDIIVLTEWQTNNNYAIDISAEELVEIAQKYYERRSVAYFDKQVTKENMMRLLAAGYPIIIPAAGQDLGNPYFRGSGPPYHMLVVTGYDQTHFYTNDPGTKRGQDYRYTHEILINAIHDWTGNTETIQEGPKAMVVLKNN